MNFFDTVPQFLQDLEDQNVDYHKASIYFELFKEWYTKQPLDGDDGIILKNTKRQLFDAFREHLPKFYVDKIYWQYDHLVETKKQFELNEKENDQELIDLLEELELDKRFSTIKEDFNSAINNLKNAQKDEDTKE